VRAVSACPVHAGETLLGACERCGDFVCKLDSEVLDGKRLCFRCSVRTEAWLEAYRRERWGKRDGFAWLFGAIVPFGAAVQALVILDLAARLPPARVVRAVAITAAAAAMGVAYFFRWRPARLGMVALPLVGFFSDVALGLDARTTGERFGQTILAVLLALGACASTGNKLYFRLDVPPDKLRKHWEIYKNNPYARSSFIGSFLGLLIPGVSLITLGGSIFGLLRVDPRANPPIGRRGQAIAGIVISALGIAEWFLIFYISKV
jgi:hypothetical protein